MTVDEKMVFSGLTAWFSSSVSQTTRQDWLSGGGSEAGVDNAQYIFSHNASSPDTQRIFKSAAYLDEHLSVFHASFINECVKKGNLEEVELGLYILPPTEVQEVVRREIGIPFIWDLSSSINNGCDSAYSGLQNDVLPSLGHTRKPESRSSSQAGPSETQSKETHSQSKLGSAHKQKGNQSASKSASDNQSKTVGQKDSPKGKKSDRTKESELRDDRTNIPTTSRVIKQKEKKQASPGRGGISPGKHKQAVDDKDHPEKEKKQRLAADVVVTADLEEVWRLENMAKVMDKLDDFPVGKPGFNISRK